MTRYMTAAGIALGSVALYAATPEAETPEKKEKLETMTLSIKKGLDFEFVKCPAGSFTMGVIGDLEEKSPKREHKVTLTRPFWMMTKKVTWKQWKANGGKLSWWYPKSVDMDDIPVFRISHNEALKFCDKMTKRFKNKLPKGCVLRLPTEAEWEYALNANCEDEENPYIAFRDKGKCADKIMTSEADVKKMVAADDLEGIAWMTKKDMGLWKFLATGGTKQPNAWGIYDMLANGGEMTLDVISYGDYGGDHGAFAEHKLWDKLTYGEEETDPFKFDAWGDAYVSRGIPGNCETTHKGDWFAKDVMPRDQMKFSLHGFRLVIGPDYVGEWKAKNAAKAKATKGKQAKKSGK